jgi:O-succinylbenzoic acid--CoA ligase
MDALPTRFFFEEAVERFGEQPLMVAPGGTFTYHQIDQYVFETALRLKEVDIKKGQRIAILAPNSMTYVIFLMALWKMGVIAAPISTRLPKKQVEENLLLIESSRIILSQEHAGLYLSSDVGHFILEDLIPLPYGILPANRGNLESIESWMSQNATIIFTSGSSGRPKAVLHTFPCGWPGRYFQGDFGWRCDSLSYPRSVNGR